MQRVLILSLLSIFTGCGSLLSELDRIRNKSTAVTVSAPATAPTVLYTIPADGTVSAPVQAYIDIVFDQPIDAATVSGPPNGICTGTAQASYDDFQNCGGTPNVSGNVVRLSANPLMPQATSLKVQITSAIKGTNGLSANAYQSSSGFSFAGPCGINCFYSDSAPMTAANGSGGHSFVIPSGAKAGWILTVNGGGSTTTYWDPATNQTSAGPAVCGSVNNGGHSFEIKTLGGARSGKIITYIGGATGTACTYDPGTGTYSAGPALGGAAVNTGAMTIPLLTGGSAGNYLLLDGSTTISYLYNVGTDSYASWAGATTAVGAGAYWFRLDTGPQAGNPFIVAGAGTTATTLYSESGVIFSSPYVTAGPNGAGGFAFRVNSGALVNRFLMTNGAATTNSIGYDQNGGAIGGPTTPCPINTGSQNLAITQGPRSGQNLVLCGGNTSNYSYYDQASNAFGALFSGITGLIGSDSSMTRITTGMYAGKYFIVNGNLTGISSMYDPVQDSFAGTRLFGTTNAGLNAFPIKGGPKSGRVMIMTGGAAAVTTIYDPQTGLAEIGPTTVTLGNGALSFPVTNGVNAGNQFILAGNATTTVLKYNTSTNTFGIASLGVDYFTAPLSKTLGARHLLIPTGPQANNYLILSGGAIAADYFNTSTNTFSSAGLVTGCASIAGGSWIFKINSGAQSGKFMIICGSLTTTSIFDPGGPTFSAGPAIGTAPAAGAHGFYIQSGINAGKFLYILAAATATKIYDPSLNTWAGGPVLCGSASTGGFSIPVSAGANAGKTLVALGGGTTLTCYYNPATNSFAAGPVSGGHAGYAIGADSMVFPTGGGLYPTAYFVAHGALSTTFSHWFAY